MKQKFIGKWIRGFGIVAAMSIKETSKSEECKRRERILVFWEKYGLEATREAFEVKRSTLYLWRKKWRENDLEPKSRRPKKVRVPTISLKIIEIEAVSVIRKGFPYLGKEKISRILARDNIQVSASTVGRIIKREKLPSAPKKYVARAKQRKNRARKPADYPITTPGDIVGLDTIVIQDNNQKRYIYDRY